MKKYIYIKADTNDGDYISTLNVITEESLQLIKPVIEAIKKFKAYEVKSEGILWTHGNNFPSGEMCREDLGEKSKDELYGDLKGFELFDYLVPYGECGIHTIEEIKLFYVEDEEILL